MKTPLLAAVLLPLTALAHPWTPAPEPFFAPAPSPVYELRGPAPRPAIRVGAPAFAAGSGRSCSLTLGAVRQVGAARAGQQAMLIPR